MKEYALALEWAEASLNLERGSDDNYSDLTSPKFNNFVVDEQETRDMIMKIREDHDRAWKSPEKERGNLPNEEFFVRRTEGKLTGKELRGEEEGFQTGDAKVT